MTDGGTPIEALAARARGGDPAALDALLRAVRPEALRLCARFLPCREDAEEACQDTLLAVAAGIGTFTGRAAFRTWLFAVAANRSRSTYRRLRQRYEREAHASPPDRPDPRRTSVVAGTRLDLLDGLEALGAELAEPVALRDVLDLPYRQVAELLALPESTVRSRIHEGRRRLRERLT
ncbi:RNA polymerase sigma factor [Dactylosporangium sp. NPDC049742]|uniref:RNA polymerase sigma factor n=1 Tax=Dactylosporangium sp. NPDC049742 TaxID=3154737 RepID=UPI00341B559B